MLIKQNHNTNQYLPCVLAKKYHQSIKIITHHDPEHSRYAGLVQLQKNNVIQYQKKPRKKILWFYQLTQKEHFETKRDHVGSWAQKLSVSPVSCLWGISFGLYDLQGFPSGSNGKKICLQFRRLGFNPWVGKISRRREWQPTLVFLPKEFHVHQVRALVSCIQPGLVICFTLDNIHVSMLFS